MLFVSINFSLKKDSVVFSAFVNYNIVFCIKFSSLRLKCDCSVSRKGSQACWIQQNEPQNQ